MFDKTIDKIINFLAQYKSRTPKEEIVFSLTTHTAALGLMKNESVKLAPIKGTCGVIDLSGNSCPVFKYTVFDKKIMEFINVAVEVSKPDRITFMARIKNTDDSLGDELAMKPKYEEPFHRLASHLVKYFPYPPMFKEVEENEPVIQVQSTSS